MPPAVEALAEAALVAISADREVRGTGFVIDENSTVLTCHHVVDGLGSVQLHGPEGSTHADKAAIIAAPDIDLALIRASSPLGKPLPLASEATAMTEYWTKGYHRLSEAIRAAYPVQGRIIGRTSVSYRSETFPYDINDVLVLRDDSIDPGLSGAPVLDPEGGVVVAVVSTKLMRDKDNGGFAVPLAHAAAHPALREAVAHNQATVPAYGAYLNAPAARTLCRAVTDSEIDHLTQDRGVDLSRRAPRTGIEAAVGRFLSDDAPIFALIGPTGVGKSTEVAALAQRLPGRALLLGGSALDSDSTGGLGEAIRAALDEARGTRPLPSNADQAIARALPADSGLIVLLDALNEATLSGRALKEWIANTRSWLRSTPARLVVSCRSELWSDLVGHRLLSTARDAGEHVASLGMFTDKEYREAARAYGLSMGTDWPILRLPLALSLCTRYQQKPARTLDALMSINEVIEAYVEEAARNLAASGAGPPLSAPVMRDRLVEVAALMWEQGTDTVDMRSFGEIFGATTTLDALVSEGVMSPTPSGYRFTYDDVGDWLQAQGLDVDSELTAIFTEESSWRRVGPIASALRDVGRRHGLEALRTQLARLIQDPGTAGILDPGTAGILAFRIAEVTLAKIADAQPYGDVLGRMADMTIAAVGLNDVFSDLYVAVEFWRSVPLPLVQRLDLLRRLSRCDNYYHWRAGDWARWDDRTESWPPNRYSMLTYNLVREEPVTGIPALIPWLDDDTALAGDRNPLITGYDVTTLGAGEATVADVAMGIFYQLRMEQERLVWAAMIEAGERCHMLIGQLASDDPEFLARMISTEPNTESSDKLVVYAAAAIYYQYERKRATPSAEFLQSVSHAVASRYARGLDRQLLGVALNVLIQGADGQRYIQAVVNAYQAGVDGVNERTLAAAAAQDADEIIAPILAAAFIRGGGSKASTLYALTDSPDARVQALGDRIVRYYLENGLGDVDRDVSRYVERRLGQSHMGEDLLELIRRVINAPAGSGRYVLAYPLTDPDRLSDPAQRAILLRKFVEATTDSHSAEVTAERLLETIVAERSLPDAFELLQQVLPRIDRPEADHMLIRWASHQEKFADMLASWLTTKKLSAPGNYTRQLQARVESGERPASAVEHILHRNPYQGR